MGDLFKGWRRKTGCMLLVVACGLTGAWLRSRNVCDEFGFRTNLRQCVIYSFNGQLHSMSWDIDSNELPFDRWSTRPFADPYFETMRFDIDNVRLWKRNRHLQEWNFDYARFTIPLTLFSACLILWKRRKP